MASSSDCSVTERGSPTEGFVDVPCVGLVLSGLPSSARRQEKQVEFIHAVISPALSRRVETSACCLVTDQG